MKIRDIQLLSAVLLIAFFKSATPAEPQSSRGGVAVYRGAAANEVRTPAGKIAGRIDELIALTQGRLPPSDVATLLAYSRESKGFRDRVHEASQRALKSACDNADRSSDRVIAEEMMKASRVNNIAFEESYGGMLNSLSDFGRNLILQVADATSSNGTLSRPVESSFSDATDLQIAQMARSARNTCRSLRSPGPEDEPENSNSDERPFQRDVR